MDLFKASVLTAESDIKFIYNKILYYKYVILYKSNKPVNYLLPIDNSDLVQDSSL